MEQQQQQHVIDEDKKHLLEDFLKADVAIKEMQVKLAEMKEKRLEAIKALGFESESDSGFSSYLEKLKGSDVYKTIYDSLKMAGGAIVDASESNLAKSIGSGVKRMALNLAKSLSISPQNQPDPDLNNN